MEGACVSVVEASCFKRNVVLIYNDGFEHCRNQAERYQHNRKTISQEQVNRITVRHTNWQVYAHWRGCSSSQNYD